MCVLYLRVCMYAKNKDDKCFLYSVLCGLKCPERDAERVSNYMNRLGELQYKDEDMPMDMDKIIFFEKRNDIRINVYGLDKADVIPLYVSSIKDKEYSKISMSAL